MRYLLIDLRTGLMDGMYRSLELADGMCVKLEQQYAGSVWRILKCTKTGAILMGLSRHSTCTRLMLLRL